MASRIITKKGSGAPLASDLVHGELAVDTVNKRLYTENAGGTVIEVGTAPSTIDINAGTIDGTVIGGSSAAAGTFTSITGTSANINGTVTADGLTVDASNSTFNGAIGITSAAGAGISEGLLIDYSTNLARFLTYDSSTGSELAMYTQPSGGSTKQRFRINSDGNISFYEDTGTTAKFFWDASAESLGIGTSSPSAKLHLNSASTTAIMFDSDTSTQQYELGIGYGGVGTSSFYLYDNTASATRLVINSAGNVGIGVSAPATLLNIKGATLTTATDKREILLEAHDDGVTNSLGALTGVTFRNSPTTYTAGSFNRTSGVYGINLDGAGYGRAMGLSFYTATFDAAAQERMRIDSSGNVGIGTTTPNSAGLGANGQTLELGTRTFIATDSSGDTRLGGLSGSNITAFYQGGAERMRIDSSGNLLVGHTSAEGDSSGTTLYQNGQTVHKADGAYALELVRSTSDGDIVSFRKDSTTVGSIGSSGGTLQIDGASGGLFFTSSIEPTNGSTRTDNSIDLGSLSFRFDDIYATNGTIQTSDRNEKQDIEELSEAEQRVAVAAKGLLRKFRWKSSVEEKGDDARIHFGIIAQDLQAAFEAEGLDAGRYAMFISTTWTDEETGEERSRMGVRYSELLAFIIAAI